MEEKAIKYIGPGKRKYYLARAEMARNAKVPNIALAQSYEKLIGALPLEVGENA